MQPLSCTTARTHVYNHTYQSNECYDLKLDIENIRLLVYCHKLHKKKKKGRAFIIMIKVAHIRGVSTGKVGQMIRVRATL